MKDSDIHKLSIVQNACLRLIMGARKTTPILSLEAEAMMPPLKLLFKYSCTKEYLKMMHRLENDAVNVLLTKETSERSFINISQNFLKAVEMEMPNRQHIPAVSSIPPWQHMEPYVI